MVLERTGCDHIVRDREKKKSKSRGVFFGVFLSATCGLFFYSQLVLDLETMEDEVEKLKGALRRSQTGGPLSSPVSREEEGDNAEDEDDLPAVTPLGERRIRSLTLQESSSPGRSPRLMSRKEDVEGELTEPVCFVPGCSRKKFVH